MIFDKIIELYSKKNIFLEKNKNGHYAIVGKDTGLSITEKEIYYILKYNKFFKNPKIYIIGNAFGFSTIAFQLIFPEASIDVIDAEIEGEFNSFGSNLTVEIAKENKFDINLTKGFSPKDVKQSMRFDKYDLIFIDGLHTDEQVIADFTGVYPFFNDKYMCFFHDIRSTPLYRSFDYIINNFQGNYSEYIRELPDSISESGIGIIANGYSLIRE